MEVPDPPAVVVAKAAHIAARAAADSLDADAADAGAMEMEVPDPPAVVVAKAAADLALFIVIAKAAVVSAFMTTAVNHNYIIATDMNDTEYLVAKAIAAAVAVVITPDNAKHVIAAAAAAGANADAGTAADAGAAAAKKVIAAAAVAAAEAAANGADAAAAGSAAATAAAATAAENIKDADDLFVISSSAVKIIIDNAVTHAVTNLAASHPDIACAVTNLAAADEKAGAAATKAAAAAAKSKVLHRLALDAHDAVVEARMVADEEEDAAAAAAAAEAAAAATAAAAAATAATATAASSAAVDNFCLLQLADAEKKFYKEYNVVIGAIAITAMKSIDAHSDARCVRDYPAAENKSHEIYNASVDDALLKAKAASEAGVGAKMDIDNEVEPAYSIKYHICDKQYNLRSSNKVSFDALIEQIKKTITMARQGNSEVDHVDDVFIFKHWFNIAKVFLQRITISRNGNLKYTKETVNKTSKLEILSKISDTADWVMALNDDGCIAKMETEERGEIYVPIKQLLLLGFHLEKGITCIDSNKKIVNFKFTTTDNDNQTYYFIVCQLLVELGIKHGKGGISPPIYYEKDEPFTLYDEIEKYFDRNTYLLDFWKEKF